MQLLIGALIGSLVAGIFSRVVARMQARDDALRQLAQGDLVWDAIAEIFESDPTKDHDEGAPPLLIRKVELEAHLAGLHTEADALEDTFFRRWMIVAVSASMQRDGEGLGLNLHTPSDVQSAKQAIRASISDVANAADTKLRAQSTALGTISPWAAQKLMARADRRREEKYRKEHPEELP